MSYGGGTVDNQYRVTFRGFFKHKMVVKDASGIEQYHAYPTYEKATLKDTNKQLVAQILKRPKDKLLERTFRYITFSDPKHQDLGSAYSLVSVTRADSLFQRERFNINLTKPDGSVATYYWKMPGLFKSTWRLLPDGATDTTTPIMRFQRGCLFAPSKLTVVSPKDISRSDMAIFIIVLALVVRRYTIRERRRRSGN